MNVTVTVAVVTFIDIDRTHTVTVNRYMAMKKTMPLSMTVAVDDQVNLDGDITVR